MAYEVTFSREINSFDDVKFGDEKFHFELDKANDFPTSLIILYMYVLPDFPTHGIKVGMTTCHPGETFSHSIKKRVGQQEKELALTDKQLEIYGQKRLVVYWGVCLDAISDSFKDYNVHKLILRENAGLVEKEQEWFINVPIADLISDFQKIRQRGLKTKIYEPRKEQRDCIDAMEKYFSSNPTGGRFLLNCKMRFGKSYTTYRFCEEMGLKKILILTFVPAVENSWQEDLLHVKTNYIYLTDKDLSRPFFDIDAINKPFVMFLSLQNFLGTKRANDEVKDKIRKLQNVHFDIVVLDEYHFGAWNDRTQEKLEDFDTDYQKSIEKTKDVIKKFGIKTDKVICLSGTPFKALARGEFGAENTFTYSYFDEQKNKYPNDNFSDPNRDYAKFPDMKICGYNMAAYFGNMSGQMLSSDKLLSRHYFSLNKFFETRKDEDSSEPATFIYEEAVKTWLEIIKGRSAFGINFPYSKREMPENNKHTLWLMPSVNSCAAMAKLLANDDYFPLYEIINLSDQSVGSGKAAFDYLQEHINKAKNTGKAGSIALTVNKLTIGVTVKEWFSVFVLKDLASPEQYFQSIFRIQTPLVENDKIIKKVGLVYDFNIDRATSLLLNYADNSSDESLTKLDIAKLIVKFLPIYMNGDMEKPIEYEVFYQLAQFGDQSNIPLSKKITNLDATTHALNEETMAEMLNDPEVSSVLKKVFAHSKLKKSADRSSPSKPSDDGFKSPEAKAGRDLGYMHGLEDSHDYLDIDDAKVQETFKSRMDSYIAALVDKAYDDTKRTWFANGFIRGYESGVNVPIKKLNCGREDGLKFVEKVKERFGPNIHYTKETRKDIENFVRPYLNDISNIPEKFRGKLFKRWYVESFLRAIRDSLKPVVNEKEGGTTIGDAENVLRHILSRLVEFLYISVYRETTFSEIFKNADPDVFLEAVGITKKDFESLNKYHVFEENTLNNYIHEFFVNETLGSNLNDASAEIRKQYRNSFGWFGYNDVQTKVNAYIAASQSQELAEKALALSQPEASKEKINPDQNESPTKGDLNKSENQTDNGSSKDDIKDKIVGILKANPRGLRSGKIAALAGITKKEANRILYNNTDLFEHEFLSWKLKKQNS